MKKVGLILAVVLLIASCGVLKEHRAMYVDFTTPKAVFNTNTDTFDSLKVDTLFIYGTIIYK